MHPEVIEQELNNCPDVAHAVIFLKPHATHLTCVVDLVPPGGEEARARVTKFANSLPSAKKAAPFVEVIFADEPFTAENGMLRPNMKIDRKAIVARYLPTRQLIGQRRRIMRPRLVAQPYQHDGRQAQPGRDREHVHRGQQIGLADHAARHRRLGAPDPTGPCPAGTTGYC